jgi:gamma-glutamylputrescine oxidase
MSEPYIETYYRDTLNTNNKRAALTHDVDTDICVIGGGLAGLSTAIGLTEKSKDVVLVEANRIGWGASGRNGGYIQKGYACAYKQLVKKVGLEHTKQLHKLSSNSRAQIKERIKKYNIDCGPIINGVLGVSWNNHPKVVQNYIEWMQTELNAPLEYWSQDQVQDACKSKQYFDGFYSPEDYQFHPLNYVHGIAVQIEKQGGKIYEATKALRIKDRADGGYVVHTPNGNITCNQVVLCCSIHIDDLNKKLKYAAFPVYTFVMVTKPIPEERLNAALNTDYAIFDNRYAHDYYRRLPDNRIMWGGRVSVTGIPKNLAQIMKRDLLKVYPQLEGVVEPDYAWGGSLCYAPHKMPQIGQLKPGYWYNTCFGGHGLVPTAVGGDVVSSAIADGDERYKLFEPFSKLWFAGGPLSPYIAQSVYYLWRARDLLISLNK